MKKAITFQSSALFFLLATFQITAQIKIEGVVRDAQSEEPLEFVVITADDRQSGDVSSEQGSFVILVEKLPVTLSFRLIGYESAQIQVIKNKMLDVKMIESITEMNTVEIKASHLEKIAGNEKRSIWDYTWCNGQLLICDFGTSLKSASLILLNEKLDTLFVIPTPAKPVELFSDCMGNAHFVGQDSTWQILNLEGKISLLPAESNYLVDHILKKCKSADDKHLFFEVAQGGQWFNESSIESFSFKSNNDEIYYFYGARNATNLNFLTKITDENSKKLKEAELTRDSLMHSSKHNESYASALASKHFFYTTIVREIYAPIITVQQKTFILDYVNRHWVKFDSAMSVASCDTIGFDFSPMKPFRCITDESHATLYVLDDNGGITSIHQVNTETCTIIRTWFLPHVFPEHLSVNNGYVYYMHRDPKNRLNRFLSRLRLSE